MSRYRREPAVLQAAERWRNRCLLDDGSILSEKRLWTLENLVHLERYFVNNPDEGEGRFLEKLQGQLSPAPAAAKQLAAELLWLLYLGVSEAALKGGTKRLQIRKVWEWSGEPLPDASAELAALDRGIANPGTAYQAQRWREYRFAIELMRDWKRLPETERQLLVGDPWEFGGWVDRHPYSPGRQLRHFLLTLLFPEHYERIVTGQHKRQILETYLPRFDLGTASVDLKDRLAVDRALYQLRERLEAEYDADPLDYYLEPLRSEWLGSKGSTTPEPESDDGDADEWVRRRFGDRRVWLIAPGQGARAWPEFRAEEIIGIGWDSLGDLSTYPSREAVHTALRNSERDNPVMSALACWQFGHEIRPGDYVIAKQGRSVLLGYGVVRSDYRFDETRPEFQHVRDVEWQKEGHWTLGENHRFTIKTVTDMTPYRNWLRAAFELMAGTEHEPPESSGDEEQSGTATETKTYTVADALQSLFLSREKLTAILDALVRRKNVILEGAPGVGKTFVARRIAWALLGYKDNERVQMVQFHQSYSYEDFVQGWRPRENGGFELQDGVFHRFCRNAQQDPDNRYVFIIDEINRGNLSKVFGELMMLIEADKRGPDFAIPLTYARGLEDRFHVPENVYILGMMNTADRSLAMVDYALRRRFSFVRLEPAFGSERFSDHLLGEDVPDELVERIVDRMGELNRTIAEDTRNLGPGFEIGHSFFVPGSDEEERGEEWYERIIRYEIEPLLHEYWFDQPDRVEQQVARLLS
jgi:5-methylcytosine-specific restriction enzyme B